MSLILRSRSGVSLSPEGEIFLQIDEGRHYDLTARLRSGKLDLVVGRLGMPESTAGLSFQQLYSKEVLIVASPKSSARHIKDLAGVNAFRVLYPPQDSAIRRLIARLLISHGVPLDQNRIETTLSAFGYAITVTDLNSVWTISKGVVADDIAKGRLVSLDIDMAATSGAVGIMSRSEEIPSVTVRVFCKPLGELCADKNTSS